MHKTRIDKKGDKRERDPNSKTQFRATVTDLQTEILLQRLSSFPIDIEYQKRQQGAFVELVIDLSAQVGSRLEMAQ
jgi:hypothetical protein